MTMRRIDGMGYKAPIAWRDELYRNELTKLDIKKALSKADGPGIDSIQGKVDPYKKFDVS